MTRREMIEIVSSANSEIKRLSAALDEQTQRANHHEERASELSTEVERLKWERDAAEVAYQREVESVKWLRMLLRKKCSELGGFDDSVRAALGEGKP